VVPAPNASKIAKLLGAKKNSLDRQTAADFYHRAIDVARFV